MRAVVIMKVAMVVVAMVVLASKLTAYHLPFHKVVSA
jgi:hypothetical protein